MEALTTIGLIANIVQFVDLGGKLISSVRERHTSVNVMTKENKSLEEVTIEIRDLTMRLDPPTTEAKSDDERALRRLVPECCELSEQILRLMKKIAPTKSNSTRRITISAFKNFKHKEEKRELEKKLANCRGQLHLHFNRLTSSKVQAQLQALGNLAQSNQAILQALPRQIEQILRGTCSVPLSVGAQDQIKALLSLMDLAKEAVIVRGLLEKLAFEAMHDRDGTIQKEHSETFRWIVEHDADVDGTTLATNARKLYLSWLHSGYGIFHAAGKQGSGQSTLIQLLFKHPETRKQLLI